VIGQDGFLTTHLIGMPAVAQGADCRPADTTEI